MTSTARRTALVTGSTSGIGAATARLLAADGLHVVVTGRDKTRGDAVVAAVIRSGGSATFVASDLAGPPDELRTFARAATEAAGGHLDVLVHNAAVCPPVDTVTLTDADLDTTLAVNIRAPHVLTAALAPAMAERGSGAIVVIGSWMASVGHAFVGLYSATKAAEAQLARSWAAEFGPHGVRVNTVSPGATRTPVNDAAEDVVTRHRSRPGVPAPPTTSPPPWPGWSPTARPTCTARRSPSTGASPPRAGPEPRASCARGRAERPVRRTSRLLGLFRDGANPPVRNSRNSLSDS